MSEQTFVVGQRIDCMDGNNQKWYHATIKKVEPGKVLVAWSNPRWQSSKYDQWIIKAHYDVRIRPRYSLPKVKPGTWVRRPLHKGDLKTGKNGTIRGSYHHFIIINPLFSIGYDGKNVSFDSHFQLNEKESRVYAKYDFTKWEICRVPLSKAAAEECITKAIRRWGESKYSLIANNCEHFARDCCKGQNYSRQVRETLGVTGGTVTGAAVGGGIGAAFFAPTAASATLFGSTTVGGWAVSLGVLSAPAAPAVLPVVLGCIVVGAIGGYVASKSVAKVTEEETSKAQTKREQQQRLLSLHKKDAVRVIMAMENEVKKVKKHKNFMYAFRFWNYKESVDKYWFNR